MNTATEYLNRRTTILSAEEGIQMLIRRAVQAGVHYLRQRDTWGARDSHNEYIRALALAEAVEAATQGSVKKDDIVELAKNDFAQE